MPQSFRQACLAQISGERAGGVFRSPGCTCSSALDGAGSMTAALCSSLDASRVCWQGRSGPLTSDSLCARDFVQTLCSSGSPGVAYGIRGSLDAVSLVYGRWSKALVRGGGHGVLVHREEKREALGNTRLQGWRGPGQGGCQAKNWAQKKTPEPEETSGVYALW